MKKATIADVAEKAEVSKATISRFLKHENVRKEIAEKIQAAIEETGYVAKTPKVESDKKDKIKVIEPKKSKDSKSIKKTAMQLKKNYKFAILTTDFTKAKARNIIKGLENIWYAEGCMFQICDTQGNQELEEKYITSFIVQNVQAIFVESCSNAEFIQKQLRTTSIPVIYMNDMIEGEHCLMFDERKAGEVLANFMLEKRHLIIRYVSVDEKICEQRMQAIKDTYHARKQPVDFICKVAAASYVDIFEKIKEVFSDKIDLLILETDEMAIPLSKFIKDYHIAIPQNASVVSFGGHEILKVISPTFASVSYDYGAYARWVSDYVYALIEDKATPKMPDMIRFCNGESIR